MGFMAFDSLVANDGRLRILAALAAEGGLEFVRLRQVTELTDGNLSAHARRLQSGGLVAIEKQFRDGKPVTTIHLTDDGRQRLTAHVRALVAAVGGGQKAQTPAVVAGDVGAERDEEWVD
jgi:DNA-binding MarR family transcriptional regulator